MVFSLRRKHQAPRGRYTPNLWPVWFVAPVALITAGVLSWAIYHQAYGFFAQAATHQSPSKPVDINDVLKATVTVLTLIGAVLAGLYAYRKQLLAEGDAHRADASQLADRYTTAAEQLGHDQAAVRLAGVYALARLANDWEEQRQVCIDVLCAYLRMPHDSNPLASGHRIGDQEVRLTIIRVIRDQLQDPDAPTSWCTYNFDFTGAVFNGGDFSRSHFQGTASFANATFDKTINFDRTGFSGAVSFANATFHNRANFELAIFDGLTFFGGVTFDGRASFDRASFTGTIHFRGATFNASVHFNVAVFDGGSVGLDSATFNSGAEFDHATFSDGLVLFNAATFTGDTVSFCGATFSGAIVNFFSARFSNTVTFAFDQAIFSGGTVHFERMRLNGGTVTFDNATFSGTLITWGEIPIPPGR